MAELARKGNLGSCSISNQCVLGAVRPPGCQPLKP